MNLHRTSGRPEWQQVTPDKRNTWQRVAARSGGLLAPANIVTLAGFVMVLVALWLIAAEDPLWGLLLLAAGRLLDIVDGLVADATGTKSPMGEILDATADKVGTLLTIAILTFEAILPWWAALLLLIPQLVTTAISLAAKRQRRPLHPSQIGKYSMFVAWLALLGFVLSVVVPEATAATDRFSFSEILNAVAYVLTVAAAALGLVATIGYRRELRELLDRS